MTYRVHLADLKGNRVKTLTDKEVNVLNTSIDKLVESSKLNWGYIFIEKNRQLLIEQTDKALSELSKTHPNTWKDLEDTSI